MKRKGRQSKNVKHYEPWPEEALIQYADYYSGIPELLLDKTPIEQQTIPQYWGVDARESWEHGPNVRPLNPGSNVSAQMGLMSLVDTAQPQTLAPAAQQTFKPVGATSTTWDTILNIIKAKHR